MRRSCWSVVRRFQGSKRRTFGIYDLEEIQSLGSAARDHLANERTFLAWARTSLVFVGSGVGLHQFYQYACPTDHSQKTEHEQEQINKLRSNVVLASSSLVVIGVGVLSFATARYYSVLSALKRDKFIPNHRGVAAFSVCTTVLMCFGLVSTLKFPQYIFHDTDTQKTQ
uniref:DUF202 domain-containing protein n=1 Tax=Vannella robusta TaxID=1487602 RepID=A0A7S4MAU3_9EUKA|mmetsp:Transcript_17006/g.21686  ORF Transcript_17006/g.21686 Transcript_17006/m.21686 type:complete len:169 (+) Transcript_17006:135-641(+)